MDDLMEIFRAALIDLKARSGTKISDIAAAAGVSTRHIQGVLSEKEKKGLGRSAQIKVADFFGMPHAELLSVGMRYRDGVRDGISVEPHHDFRPLKRVPLISWVQAGGWVNPDCQTTPGHADEWIEQTATLNENAFALKIYGDSMEPEFRQGDIIVVDPGRMPESGNYVVAKNGDEEATFKQFIRDGSRVYLKPLNDRYPIRDITGQEVRIVGVAVDMRRGLVFNLKGGY